MRLPRDLSGTELARLLNRYGYKVVRQTGSHLRLSSTIKGTEHHLTIPAHPALKVGTLGAVIREVSEYLELDRNTAAEELFGR